MRTYEVPAMGGCMLVEDTDDHRQLFGREGEAVVYFRTTDEGVAKARQLLADERERRRLAAESHALVTRGRHTYGDRLTAALQTAAS
jgi:spore maturation protein CgeB